MSIVTGQTYVENIMSLDSNNNPVSGATFDILTIKDGVEYTGLTVSSSLIDATRGIFSISWSASSTGFYQFYIKNNSTNVIFMSDLVNVSPYNEFEQNIFLGL
jgi:hypothetical protein